MPSTSFVRKAIRGGVRLRFGKRRLKDTVTERGIAVATEQLEGPRGELRLLFLGERRLVAKLCGTFEWRGPVVGPDTLEIRMAVRGLRW